MHQPNELSCADFRGTKGLKSQWFCWCSAQLMFIPGPWPRIPGVSFRQEMAGEFESGLAIVWQVGVAVASLRCLPWCLAITLQT